MTELPITVTTRMLKKADNTINVSKEAKNQYNEELERIGKEISERAIELAKKDGRKTIMEQDIRRWKPVTEETEILEGEFLYRYKQGGNIYYHQKTQHLGIKPEMEYLSIKYLKSELLFEGKLWKLPKYGNDENEAKKIMEKSEGKILDSLMEPHWAYNIYEFRDWRPVKEINEHAKLLLMWFDDYDGGDVFVEGYLFNEG